MDRYLVIEPSGELWWISCHRKGLLNALHSAIGCDCVENVHSIFSPICLIVDESGRIKTPPQVHNPLASLLYAGWILGCDDIVGPCVLASMRRCDNEYGDMDWFPLNDDELSVLSIYLDVNIPEFPAMFSGGNNES